jgi:hypothetical protein
VRCLKLRLAHTEKELYEQASQSQDFGHQFGFERKEGQRLTAQDPCHYLSHFLHNPGSRLFHRRSGSNIVRNFRQRYRYIHRLPQHAFEAYYALPTRIWQSSGKKERLQPIEKTLKPIFVGKAKASQ